MNGNYRYRRPVTGRAVNFALLVAVVATIFLFAKAAAGETPVVPIEQRLRSQRESELARENRHLRRRVHRVLHKLRWRELQVRRLHRVLRQTSSVAEAINLAAAVYDVSSATLWRKARCESGLEVYARNPSGASGLFQFLPSTWRSTPFGGFSIWSPYANALAAGWMHRVGRGGEWVCK